MGHRVLVVEDDRVMARLEGSALERAGIATLTAHTATQALDYAATEEFDLVVLDLFLPDGDGVAICSQIRAFNAVPVLMVSCLEDDYGQPLTGQTDGPHMFLAKPFSMHEFVERVRDLLGPGPSETAAE